MNVKLIAPLSLAFLLAACAGNAPKTDAHAHGHHHHHHHHHSHHAHGTQSFACENGATVHVSSAGQDKVRVAVDTIGDAVVLTRVRTASGEGYDSQKGFYNKRTEWHQKGTKMGYLSFTDPYGNAVETACEGK